MRANIFMQIMSSIKFMLFKNNENSLKMDSVVPIEETLPNIFKKSDEVFVNKAITVVKKKIDDPCFKKEDFARTMNVSSSLLYVKIKTLTKLSPTDFVKTIRLDYGFELLKSGEYTVTEISEKIGFNNLGYFSTQFKKYYGISPSQLLKNEKRQMTHIEN